MDGRLRPRWRDSSRRSPACRAPAHGRTTPGTSPPPRRMRPSVSSEDPANPGGYFIPGGSGCFGAAAGLPAILLFEVSLAQTDVLGSDLHQLIVLDELQGLLQGETQGRGQEDVLVTAGGTDVGELLGLER